MWNRNVRERTNQPNVSFRQSLGSGLCVREWRSLFRSFMFRSIHLSQPDHANPTQPLHYSGCSAVRTKPSFRSHTDNLVGMYRCALPFFSFVHSILWFLSSAAVTFSNVLTATRATRVITTSMYRFGKLSCCCQCLTAHHRVYIF